MQRKKYQGKGMGPGQLFVGITLLWVGVLLVLGVFFLGDYCRLRIDEPEVAQELRNKWDQADRDAAAAERAAYQQDRKDALTEQAERFASDIAAELAANGVTTGPEVLPCFAARASKGHEPAEYSFPISGDPRDDVIVFLFNGRDLVRQIYIPAGGTYRVSGLFGGHMFSAMIIFGKDFDAAALDPCNGTGFFRSDITYAGIDSYAARPFPFEADMHDVLNIRRNSTRKKYSKDKFFAQLEKFY